MHFECPASAVDPEQEKPRMSPPHGAAAGPALMLQVAGGPPQGLGPIPDDNGNPQDAIDHR